MKKAPLKIALAVAAVFASRGALAQTDVISIPASTGGLGPNPTSVTIPISITDNAGTPLTESNGSDQARISGVSVRINYSPAAAVTSASLTIPAATAGNPCSNASGPLKIDGSGTGFVGTAVVWPIATRPVFTVGTAQPCLALTLNFDGPNFPPAGVSISIDTNAAVTNLANQQGNVTECVNGAVNCAAGSGLSVSAAGTVTPVHLTKFSAE